MERENAAWRVWDNYDDDEVRALLEQDRIWNSFALADLLPPFHQYTRFYTAARPGQRPSALLLIIQHPGFSTISPFGEADGVAAILAGAALPGKTLAQTMAEHRPLLEEYYRPAPAWPEMLRMAVTAQTLAPQPASAAITRLGASDLAEVAALYARYPASPFRPDLLDEGVFYGLRADDGRLVAIAGTHVVVEPFGVAVVGNVFTDPAARGRGYAGMVTSAIVADLLARGCRDVVLNVFAENAPAIAVYRRLGFATRHHLWSGQAERRRERPT